MGNNQKWLVYFLESITSAQWFLITMGSITALFIKLMMSYHARSNQRNFKNETFKEKQKKDIVKKI